MSKHRKLSGNPPRLNSTPIEPKLFTSMDSGDLPLTKKHSYQTRGSETHEIYSPSKLPSDLSKYMDEANERLGSIHGSSREDQINVFRRGTYQTQSSEVHDVYGDYHKNLVDTENETTQKMVAEAHAQLGPVDVEAMPLPWQPKEISEHPELADIPTDITGGLFVKSTKPKVDTPKAEVENGEVDAEDAEPEEDGPTTELHYWKVRGKNMYIRAALEYFEIPYKNCPLDLGDWTKDDAPSGEQTHPKLVDKSGEATVEINGFDEVLNYVLTKAGKRDFLYKTGCNPDDESEVTKYAEVRDKILEMQNSLDKAQAESGDLEEYKSNMDALLENWKKGSLQELSDELDGESWLFEASKPSYSDFLLWEMVNKLIAMHYDLKFENSVMRFRKLLLHNDRANELPQVAGWKQSERWVDRPFNYPGSWWA